MRWCCPDRRLASSFAERPTCMRRQMMDNEGAHPGMVAYSPPLLPLTSKKPHAYEHKQGQYDANPNSRGHATKRGLRVSNPNSRGHAIKRGLRVPNPNSRGHTTKRGLRVPNPNSRGHATKHGLRVPNHNSRGTQHNADCESLTPAQVATQQSVGNKNTKERKNVVPRLPLKECCGVAVLRRHACSLRAAARPPLGTHNRACWRRVLV